MAKRPIRNIPSPTLEADRKRYQMDIIAFAYEVLGYRGFPTFQRVILRKMMTTAFLYNSSGYGTGKTMLHAIFAAWRCICFDETTVGVISHSFRGSKMVFTKMLSWYYSIPRFKAEVYTFSKSNDVWTFLFRKPRHGLAEDWSQVRCLPPDFLNDSERMQSEDWNVGLFDEWTNYPMSGFDALNNVLLSRTRKPSGHLRRRYPYLPEDILKNKRIFSSIGSWKFRPAYRKIQIALDQMRKGNTKYWYCAYCYEDFDGDWFKELVDIDLIEDQKRELSPQMFDLKWRGRWQDGSGGPYDPQVIDKIRRGAIMSRTKGEEGKVYVMGVDPATPASRSDFAVQVLEVDLERDIDIFVYGKSKKNVSLDQMVSIIHETVLRFPGTAIIVCDPGGGGSNLMPMLNTNQTSIKGVLTEVEPLLGYGVGTDMGGRHIIVPFAQNSLGVIKLFPKEGRIGKSALINDADLINRMHTRMIARIENEGILSPRDELKVVDGEIITQNISHEEREVMKHIDATWDEVCTITIKEDKDGVPETDSRGFFKYMVTSNKKKDRAYALLYANLGAAIYRKLQQHDEEIEDELMPHLEEMDEDAVISSIVSSGEYGNYGYC